MWKKAISLLNNQRGQIFLENALLILLFSLAVGVAIIGLSNAVINKIWDMEDRINDIGI